MERIAIFAALRWECQPALRQLRQVSRERLGEFTMWRGRTSRQEVWLIQTGMGEQRAGAAAQLASDACGFGLFLNTGCAGALAPELVPGDLAVATAIIGDSGAQRFETSIDQGERARRAAARATLRVTVGPVLCSGLLATAAAKHAAAATHGAVAVEMEGAAIAACAARAGIPFVSVRTILDTAHTELRLAGHVMDEAAGTVRPLALAAYVARHPKVLPDLLALQRMQQAAQESLNRFFSAWFTES